MAVALAAMPARQSAPSISVTGSAASRVGDAAQGRDSGGDVRVRAARRPPLADADAPTQVSGRLRTVLESRVRAVLAGCAGHDNGPLVRVLVTFDALVANGVRIDRVAVRGAGLALARIDDCVRRELGRAEIAAPDDAVAGSFPVAVSTMLATAQSR